MRDLRWYNRKVVDRKGAPRRFHGGPLRRFSLELDALFYGVPRQNQVARDISGLSATCRLLEVFAGWDHDDSPVIPEPVIEDTTEWITHLHSIWDADNIAGSGGETGAVDFKLDVLLALSYLHKSQLAAFIAFMDGYTLEEIRSIACKDPARPWSIETAERAVRRASTAVRSRCGLDVPRERRQTLVDVHETSVIGGVEVLIAGIRERRPQ